MKIQVNNSKISIDSQASDTTIKKEWNAPEINIVVPVNRTASAPTPFNIQEAGNYATS